MRLLGIILYFTAHRRFTQLSEVLVNDSRVRMKVSFDL
jgi:hypothetical protein